MKQLFLSMIICCFLFLSGGFAQSEEQPKSIISSGITTLGEKSRELEAKQTVTDNRPVQKPNESVETQSSNTENIPDQTLTGESELLEHNEAEPVESEPPLAEEDTLFSVVKQGGPLMVFILLLEVMALTIIVERVYYYTRKKYWGTTVLMNELDSVSLNSSAYYREDIEDELREFSAVQTGRMERGLALLVGIGSVAPIVGFLGTVLGMIDAFASIAAASTVNVRIVASGIQVALITTAGGLIVAAPALIAYYSFSHLVQSYGLAAVEKIETLVKGKPRLSDTAREEKNGKKSSRPKTAKKV